MNSGRKDNFLEKKKGVLELSSAPLPHAQAALHEQAGRAHLPAILFYGGYQVAYQNSLLLYLQECLLDLLRLVAEQQVFAQGFHSQNCLLPCRAQLAGFCQTWNGTSSHFWAELCCPGGLCKALFPGGSASPDSTLSSGLEVTKLQLYKLKFKRGQKAGLNPKESII